MFDLKFIIYDTDANGELVGSFSKYTTTVHPGTGKFIEGWHWDDRTFPSEDNDYSANVPTIHNPVLSGIDDSNFQSGIGSPEDLEVVAIDDIVRSGVAENWAPVINHGYFYQNRDHGYLFSDAVRTEYPSVSGVTTSGYSHIVLQEFPKNSAPIKARSWTWNTSTNQYDIDIEYSKRES